MANDVILIRIRGLYGYTKIDDLKPQIIKFATTNRIKINTESSVDLSDIYIPPAKKQRCVDNIEKRNGKLLSNYINALTKVDVLCDKGHIFHMKPNNIQQGQWCPYCARVIRAEKTRQRKHRHG